jgi:hypothetical protein
MRNEAQKIPKDEFLSCGLSLKAGNNDRDRIFCVFGIKDKRKLKPETDGLSWQVV